MTSKLLLRSEVLAVLQQLNLQDTPSKQDRAKWVKRLRQIDDRKAVLEILVKELQRCGTASSPTSASPSTTLQHIGELLMDLGTIEQLREPLWQLIESPKVSDDVKDAANLVLRQLGDATDPELYLEYLDDPEGLITRETERMLSVAAENPEALIDFMDFITALPDAEQRNLIQSLQADYSPDQLLHLFIPLYWAIVATDFRLLLLQNLHQCRTPEAADFVAEALATAERLSFMGSALTTTEDSSDDDALPLEAVSGDQRPVLKRLLRLKKELTLAGCYRLQPEDPTILPVVHPLIEKTTLAECYTTLPDGIGNQGFILSRKHPNGDLAVISIALNDLHGVIDSFGFYQVSPTDFNRLCDKFYEFSVKLDAPADYCAHRFHQARARNIALGLRIPYEFTAWECFWQSLAPATGDTETVEAPHFACVQALAQPEQLPLTHRLYCHPDFETWFLEKDDHPVVASVLDFVEQYLAPILSTESPDDPTALASVMIKLDQYAVGLAQALLTTDWRVLLGQRLVDAAFLLNQPGSQSFAMLAATEALQLLEASPEEEQHLAATGFMKAYGQRCIEEHLLRLKEGQEGLSTPNAELWRKPTSISWIASILDRWAKIAETV